MMTLHPKLYCPVLMDLKKNVARRTLLGQVIIGYAISESVRECRETFASMMGTGRTWADLSKLGWRIKPVELCADEVDICPGETS